MCFWPLSLIFLCWCPSLSFPSAFFICLPQCYLCFPVGLNSAFFDDFDPYYLSTFQMVGYRSTSYYPLQKLGCLFLLWSCSWWTCSSAEPCVPTCRFWEGLFFVAHTVGEEQSNVHHIRGRIQRSLVVLAGGWFVWFVDKQGWYCFFTSWCVWQVS